MNKLLSFARTKGKRHNLSSFLFRRGVKLHKNFAPKTLVALTAIAMLSASVWGVGGGFFGGPTPGNGLLGVATVAIADDEPEEPEEPDPCANGHSFSEYTYNGDATCTEDGTMTATCSNDKCYETDTKDDPAHPAKGHKFSDYKLDPGSTCEHGTMTAVCETCRDATHTITASHVLASPWGSYSPATCTESGTMSRSCANCSYKEEKEDPYAPPLGHKLEEKFAAATPTTIGATQQVCTRCLEVISSDYFMMDGTFPTLYADARGVNASAPAAMSSVQDGDKTYTIILQDPLYALVEEGSLDELGLEVSLNKEHSDFDGFADGAPDSGDTSQVESLTTFNIVPTVNGERKSGQLNKKVRMLYLLNNGEDREEMETVLISKGVDTQFAEDLDTIGDDKYLVTWTDHFSTYAFIDRLTDGDKVQENSFPVFPVVISSSVLIAACVAGAFIYIKKKKNTT